jgi:exopolyphosphatase/guanosine-5'-triphosphate,3'-diphosphate pyrophosphatase
MPDPKPEARPANASPCPEAAIHIGAGSVSMMVAERRDGKSMRPLDFLEQPVPLARDLFRSGVIRPATIERVVSILQSYTDAIRELGLGPEHITRVAATNILAEARNHEMFLQRIRIACGLRVAVIDDGEMTRLIYLKTRRRLKHVPAMNQGNTLVVHVGPGNTRVLLFQNGLITRYTNYRMGTHRTREAVEGLHAEGTALLRVIREHTSGNLAQLRHDYSDVTIDGVVAIGYEIQSVADDLSGRQTNCKIKSLRQFSQLTAGMSDVEMVKRHQIDYQTAEALVPALEINLAIAEALGAETVHIPSSEYEQGLLHDILVSRELTGAFAEEVLRSARILAARYQSDPGHGEHVATLCAKFFDELRDLHQLGAHDALLLQVAAILHEVGTYVSPRAHHKHSEYLILNSEVFGLDRSDATIVALVARYHRHSPPMPDHARYAALSQEERIRVCKLAAILRVADALERTHIQRVARIEVSISADKLRIRLPGLADAAVERLAMESKADLFEDVFGLQVVIDESR